MYREIVQLAFYLYLVSFNAPLVQEVQDEIDLYNIIVTADVIYSGNSSKDV